MLGGRSEELGVADGELTRPAQNDIERRMLERRGLEHEARVIRRRVGGAVVLEEARHPEVEHEGAGRVVEPDAEQLAVAPRRLEGVAPETTSQGSGGDALEQTPGPGEVDRLHPAVQRGAV